VTVNIISGPAAVGTYPLANNWDTSGSFTLGTLPANVLSAHLDTSTSTIKLVVTQVQSVVSTNALLSSLAFSPAGTVVPTFGANVLSYVTSESYGNTPTVMVVDADLTATNQLIYDGSVVGFLTSGVASSPLTLNPNPGVTNIVQVLVTAQDGVTTNLYTVNVAQLPSQASPHLTNSMSGKTLTLNWPLANLGYRLLIQTNNLNRGISQNAGDWGTVAGSIATNTASINIVTTNLDEYFRLVYP
jgi:hypothetical protein